MLKRIVIVVVGVLLLFAIGYGVHAALLHQNLSFSLLHVYLFFTVSTIIVYAIIEAIASVLPNQAGYAYLAMMCIKIGVFVLIFKEDVFLKADLSQAERVSLIVPLFLFLAAEALAVVKLLNDK